MKSIKTTKMTQGSEVNIVQMTFPSNCASEYQMSLVLVCHNIVMLITNVERNNCCRWKLFVFNVCKFFM